MAKGNILKWLRVAAGLVFLAGLTWLLCDTTESAHRCVAWMAKIQFLPAVLRTFVAFSAVSLLTVVALLVLTKLFGRIYCSVVCPMGVMQDLFTWVGNRKVWRKLTKRLGPNRWHYESGHPNVRNAVLAVFCILLVFWHPIASVIAPYSAFARMIAAFGGKTSGLVFGVSIALFVIIGVWAFIQGRAWCNTICPVGTMLGMLSKHSVYAPRIDADKCTGCRACERNCKAQCIDIQNHSVDTSRCVDCFDCLTKCKFDALHFARNPLTLSNPLNSSNSSDPDRRRFLGMLGALAVTGVAHAQHKTTDGGLAVIEDKRVPARAVPIKPVGSQSIRRFTQLCTSCQLCVTACPQHVLRPSTDLRTLMQPEIQYDQGYCLTGCTRCADICPTGAILPVTKTDKTAWQIGHAVWIRENCVVETDGVSCGNCARHCPTGAIMMVENDFGQHIPTVDTERCIGCGHCEYVCPARPFSAIYVEGHQQHRKI